MENYENLGTIGEGTYGVVIKARHKETGQIVAIKKFKESEDDEQVRKTSLREVRVLKQLRHDNIINLLEVFRRKGKLYLVFEYVEKTILELLEKHPYGLDDADVKRYTYQLLRGVEYCHAHGIVHRDIKPENILISKHGALKLCDFGFARLLSGPGAQYTDYVATRWYRSPELLVGDTEYGKGVDIWAIGCIFAEITNGIPLFPGESDIDQLFHIIKCFGHITPWQGMVFNKNPLYHGIELPNPVELDTLDKRFEGQVSDIHWLLLLKSCLANEPRHRSTCTELLSSAYFASCAFAEKYEEELKVIMEKDAAANLMRLRRQKQRRPRSNTKSTDLGQTNGGQPSTPQHAWAISSPANVVPASTSTASKPPRRSQEELYPKPHPQEQSGGLPNLKIQTPRPHPVCGFPYSEPHQLQGPHPTGHQQFGHAQHAHEHQHHPSHAHPGNDRDVGMGSHPGYGAMSSSGAMPMPGPMPMPLQKKGSMGGGMGIGSSLPCLAGGVPEPAPVKLRKKNKKGQAPAKQNPTSEYRTMTPHQSEIDLLLNKGMPPQAQGNGNGHAGVHHGHGAPHQALGHPSTSSQQHAPHQSHHGHTFHHQTALGHGSNAGDLSLGLDDLPAPRNPQGSKLSSMNWYKTANDRE
eukprot:TRINITY_DN24900_c0_g1_i1.p1 TRINITY_DN24900_c0_g1~~TRINITY_DN24900_c0_g1_i1.p1  ORF type:complete len:636 (+),score=235.53 TRINITY_DN24900_c0_g1_i1:193-2100(+)